MTINGKSFKDIMRERLTPEKVIYNREVNHGEVNIKTRRNKKTISYCVNSDLYVLEYTNDLLDRIFINNELKFEY